MQKTGLKKDRNGMDLTEEENIKKSGKQRASGDFSLFLPPNLN